MKDNENSKWTKEDIAKQYKFENPNWTWSKCWNKSNLIYKELKKMNKQMWDNNKVFFKMNTPFSFYYDKDDEFANKYELRNE
jgi:hypothetical protein